MPLNLPAELVEDKNDVNQTAPWLVLVDVIMPDTTEINIVNNNEDVLFNSKTYSAYHFNLDYVVNQASDGKITNLVLSVSNVNRYVLEIIDQHRGGVGADVKIMVVKYDSLGSDYTDLTLQFSVVSSTANEKLVEFTLGAPNPMNQKFPSGRYMAMSCRYKHFKGVECKYAGGATECDRRYETCESLGNEENFGGFIGLSRIGYRVV